MPQIQRWYQGFSYTGNPKQLVEQISKQVQQHNLSQFVPLLRVQKGVKRGRFYFFIAIESPQINNIPTEVKSILLQLSFFQYPIKGSPSFTYEQIKSMVGAAHDVYDYTNQIPYQPLQESTYDNPFNLIESAPISNPSLDIDAISRRYEQLLYWLSALGSGTWESFNRGCDALKLEQPKRILRRLRLLGHMETSLDGSRWSIAPTTLVKVGSKSDFQEFVLCGERSINSLQKLGQYAKLEFSNQATGEAPPCVCLQLNNADIFFDLLKQGSSEYSLINIGEASKQLASILPTVETWKQSLRSLQGIVPSLYEWKRFDGKNFVSCVSPTETGMYQMWKTQMSDRPLYTLFHDKESDSWLQGDWYGLRFLELHYNGHNRIACYDVTKKRLAISVSQRWPEVYERALVLSSGKIPIFHNSQLFYENVQLEVVHQISNKLNITVIS